MIEYKFGEVRAEYKAGSIRRKILVLFNAIRFGGIPNMHCLQISDSRQRTGIKNRYNPPRINMLIRHIKPHIKVEQVDVNVPRKNNFTSSNRTERRKKYVHLTVSNPKAVHDHNDREKPVADNN